MSSSAAAIPITLLTRFLGSGKTTLLNRLLEDQALEDTALIINEFGSVPVDHDLVRRGSEQYMSRAFRPMHWERAKGLHAIRLTG